MFPVGAPPRLASRRGYVLGVVLLAVAAAAMFYGVGAIFSFARDVNAFTRFDVPGSKVVHVAGSGTMDIFADVNNSATDVPELSTLRLTIAGPDGSVVAVDDPSASETYDINGRHGQLIARFKATRAGSYRITSSSQQDARVAVGRLAVGSTIARTFVGFGIGALFAVAAIALMVVTGVRRGAAKRAQAASGLGFPATGASA